MEEIDMDSKEQSVLDTMTKEGKPMRPGDIAKKADMDKDEVSKIIDKLKKEGKVSSPKRCFYAPV
jgi:DNA-binding MarR family transcriptional regulator